MTSETAITVISDTGEVYPVRSEALRDSAFRHVRPGQRVWCELTSDGHEVKALGVHGVFSESDPLAPY